MMMNSPSLVRVSRCSECTAAKISCRFECIDTKRKVTITFYQAAQNVPQALAATTRQLEKKKVVSDKLGKTMNILRGVGKVVEALGDVSDVTSRSSTP